MNKLEVVKDQEDPFFIILVWGGEPWKKVYKYLFLRRLKPLFSTRSLEEMESAFLQIEEKAAKYFAINALGKKSLLTSELIQKMREKCISEGSVAKTLAFCQKIGALSDSEVLEQRIQKDLRKGRGLFYVRAKWRKSEVPIQWDSLEKRELEKQALHELIRKQGKRKDLFGFLLRRGFRSELIREVLNSGPE